MIDREQAIEAVMASEGCTRMTAERIADAFPDPVHEAARETLRRFWALEFYEARTVEDALQPLRAALADEHVPVPVPITDEMVERAARAHWASNPESFDSVNRAYRGLLLVRARAALDAALNGGE